ncbi:protein of unknown function (plasmid) [Shinella sp. WSC3-e]|nr:hypothetical protein SHINE37_110214 [Rhizobiaceae bacterium]CAK7260666.1 protein of unknown function [Shinella sp. WSC3-e]
MLDGLARRIDPEQFLAQSDRFSRATVRIMLRQQYRLGVSIWRRQPVGRSVPWWG